MPWLTTMLVLWGVMLVQVGFAQPQHTWVVLGDSISAGYGLPAGTGWVSRLQDRLNRSGYSVQVVNESISGDTSAGGVSRIANALERHRPDLILIELGGNDGLRGLSIKAMRENLSKLITLSKDAGAQVVLLGMKIPPNYGPKYTKLFEQSYVEAAKQHQVPLLPFLLEGVGGHPHLMQEDRIHPNEAAQVVLMENVWNFLQTLQWIDTVR